MVFFFYSFHELLGARAGATRDSLLLWTCQLQKRNGTRPFGSRIQTFKSLARSHNVIVFISPVHVVLVDQLSGLFLIFFGRPKKIVQSQGIFGQPLIFFDRPKKILVY